MEIKFTPQEAEKHFHDALCNGLGYVQSGYGIELTYDENDYAKGQKSIKKKMASGKLPKDTICYEDVLMEILRIKGKLKLVDESNGMGTKIITLKDVHARVAMTPLRHLMDAINESGDAVTADVIIQTVFYKDVIFG
jgi:hypothetical protein